MLRGGDTRFPNGPVIKTPASTCHVNGWFLGIGYVDHTSPNYGNQWAWSVFIDGHALIRPRMTFPWGTTKGPTRQLESEDRGVCHMPVTVDLAVRLTDYNVRPAVVTNAVMSRPYACPSRQFVDVFVLPRERGHAHALFIATFGLELKCV